MARPKRYRWLRQQRAGSVNEGAPKQAGRRGRVIWTSVVMGLVVVLVVGALFLLRNTLHGYPCDASGTDPRCQISNAPGH